MFDFLAKEIIDCERHGIRLVFSPDFYIENEGVKCAGWFDEESLQVATGKPIEEWLPIFVHESCHKDQFLEQSPLWTHQVDDALFILNDWIDHKIELEAPELNKIITLIQNLELDCEVRTVRKIVDNKLPIDVELYIKKANAYIWYHRTFPFLRKWVMGVYNNENVLKLMPNHFNNDFTVMPEGFLNVVRKIQ